MVDIFSKKPEVTQPPAVPQGSSHAPMQVEPYNTIKCMMRDLHKELDGAIKKAEELQNILEG